MGKRLLSSLLAATLLATSFTPAYAQDATQASAIDSELSGHWAEASLARWLDEGLLAGYPDGSVRPDQPVARAEFVALLNRMFGFTSSAQVDYKDIGGDEWFSADVMKAYSSGLANGYPDGTFRPSAPITRQDAVTALAR
ncbi:MAG TPA: S-layer homology domain-containing protein, partial [Paenibacillus sp.]|nr:S-layer homology domain-containing protein [Paenibacillus sp.]